MENKSIALRLASALLLHNGELSINDIAALPMVEDEEDIFLILSLLLQNFDAEIQQRRVKSSSLPAWEEFITLKPKSAVVATG